MGMQFAETDLKEQRLVGEARRSEGIRGARNPWQKEGNSNHHSVFMSDIFTDGKHRKIYLVDRICTLALSFELQRVKGETAEASAP